MNYGIENYNVNKLVVNEQNLNAKGFYEYMGFRTFKRTELDEQGNPYQAVYFGDGEEMDRYLMQKYGEERLIQGFRGGLMQGQMEISIVYSPQINSYNGRESIQILIQYYQ